MYIYGHTGPVTPSKFYKTENSSKSIPTKKNKEYGRTQIYLIITQN
jgi:hypothetical protein